MNTREPQKRLKLTPPELARRWGISSDKVRAWIRSGKLAAIDAATRPGGRPRFLIDVRDLAAFEAARRVHTKVPTKRRPRQRDAGVINFF